MKEQLRIGQRIPIYEVIGHHILGENLFDIASQRSGYATSDETIIRMIDNEGDLMHMTIDQQVKLCGYSLKVKKLK